jgi:CDP-4-dehydro-6-deoxyglucose reductase
MNLPSLFDIVCERAEPMSSTVRGFTFRILETERFDFQPGQWVSLILSVNGNRLVRPYSIASASRGQATIDLAVTHVEDGPAAEFLYGVKRGDRLAMTGPFGTFLLREPIDRPIYFVATGTGVAPVRSMLFELLERRRVPVAITLIFGVRSTNDILYRGDFDTLERRHKNFTFIPTLSRPPEDWPGVRGYVQKACETLLKPWRESDVYVCGVRKMVDDVRARLKSWGYDRRFVHYERYD